MSERHPDYERLRWQCRRGMLELDFLLQRYLDTHFNTAPGEEQALFVQLLREQDPELQKWLINGDEPPEAFRALVDKIRGI